MKSISLWGFRLTHSKILLCISLWKQGEVQELGLTCLSCAKFHGMYSFPRFTPFTSLLLYLSLTHKFTARPTNLEIYNRKKRKISKKKKRINSTAIFSQLKRHSISLQCMGSAQGKMPINILSGKAHAAHSLFEAACIRSQQLSKS